MAMAKTTVGDDLAPQPEFAWTVSGGGDIVGEKGIFFAGAEAGGPHTVTAAATYKGITQSGTATVLVIRPLTLSLPQEGTSLDIGDTLVITWTRLPDFNSKGVDVQFSKDNGKSWFSILTDPPLIADGSPDYYVQNMATLKWVVPQSFVPEGAMEPVDCMSATCKIRLNCPYATIVSMDISGFFAIGTTGINWDFAAPLYNGIKPLKGIPVLIYDIKGGLRQRMIYSDIDRMKIKSNGYWITVPDQQGKKHPSRMVR
jgi:hypothetical protein